MMSLREASEGTRSSCNHDELEEPSWLESHKGRPFRPAAAAPSGGAATRGDLHQSYRQQLGAKPQQEPPPAGKTIGGMAAAAGAPAALPATAPAEAAKKGRKKVEPVDLDAIEDPQERKRQRRLQKNRRTAATSRCTASLLRAACHTCAAFAAKASMDASCA
jgi:hypothetical protein